MDRIGILTLYYKNDNYGGIAQAYALQKYIEGLGYDSKLISYRRSTPPMLAGERFRDGPLACLRRKAYRLPEKIAQRLQDKLAGFRYGAQLAGDIQRRKEAFEQSRRMASHTDTVYTEETIQQTAELFDCFVSGSDQIWKPGVIRPAFVCDFLPPDKRRFSYASSITVQKLSEEYGIYMKRALSNYEWISVREEDGREYLQKLLNREVDVVVDPTLLLSASEWESVTADRMAEGKYIFVYLLGQSRKQRRDIQAYARKLHLEIVFLPHVEGKVRACDIGFGNRCLYDVKLSDFFGLIKNAEMVFTDSFHAVVFSVIFRKQFWVYERDVLQSNGGMESRVHTLLKLTGLQNRSITAAASLKETIDYDAVYERLEPVIISSQKRLKRALEKETKGQQKC